MDSGGKLQGQSKVFYLDPGSRLKGHNLESEVDITGILTERYGDSNWKSQQLMSNR